MELSLEWSEVEALAIRKDLDNYIQYVEKTNEYFVYFQDGAVLFTCYVRKGTAEATAFENTYKDNANVAASTKIFEEYNPTAGHFQSMERAHEIPSGTAGDVTSWDLTWDHGIAIYMGRFYPAVENEGDSLEVHLAPDMIVGALTSNVSIGDTVLNVSATVLENMDAGYRVSLFDGTNTDELGICTSKDVDAGTLTVNTASTKNFSAATPTYVRMTQVMCMHEFGYAYERVVGQSKIGGSFMPAGVVFRFVYTNNDGLAKVFNYVIEYTY
jgi:hypothetical protein